MPNVAILAGNTEYQHLGRLDCCDEDVLALQELLEATAKFDVVELLLNSDSARLKDRITPKFVALNRFVLVVSCAPSLEICYVMELLTRHLRRDWDEFDSQGAEVTRRW